MDFHERNGFRIHSSVLSDQFHPGVSFEILDKTYLMEILGMPSIISPRKNIFCDVGEVFLPPKLINWDTKLGASWFYVRLLPYSTSTRHNRPCGTCGQWSFQQKKSISYITQLNGFQLHR
jgi:hypothetical protein